MENYVDGSKLDRRSFYGITKSEELCIDKDSIKRIINESFSN